jgi:preprotein translocase SecE subunit
VARNRKKAKERRARRPANGTPGQAAAAARVDAPDPIEHASPDVELAEAQLALGRPKLPADAESAGEDADAGAEDAEPGAEEELADARFGEGPDLPGVFPGRVGVEVDEDEEGEMLPAAPSGAAPAQRRARPGKRLINFLQGSWRELQRVQWPDRRQVMQATGVVIGFVIVAGVFLGVADFLATKIMNYILTGHFK